MLYSKVFAFLQGCCSYDNTAGHFVYGQPIGKLVVVAPLDELVIRNGTWLVRDCGKR